MKTIHFFLALTCVFAISCGSSDAERSKKETDRLETQGKQRLSDLADMEDNLQSQHNIKFSYPELDKIAISYEGDKKLESVNSGIEALRNYHNKLDELLNDFTSDQWFVSNRSDLEAKFRVSEKLLPEMIDLRNELEKLEKEEKKEIAAAEKREKLFNENLSKLKEATKKADKDLDDYGFYWVDQKDSSEDIFPVLKTRVMTKDYIDENREETIEVLQKYVDTLFPLARTIQNGSKNNTMKTSNEADAKVFGYHLFKVLVTKEIIKELKNK